MIWLASFPRSGNTWVRNILFDVYDIVSSTYHKDDLYPIDNEYYNFPFVKTHLLPHQIIPNDINIKVVYIIRDGRDALNSIAHHRKDIIAPGSDYHENLKAAIIAEKGSFFGGWSENVNQWISRADLIIRYEDLLIDPINEVERIRKLVDLPIPDLARIPTFKDCKYGTPEYGSRKNLVFSHEERKYHSEKFFRKGKSGSWKEEMPVEFQDLFWSYHGETMLKLGYQPDGTIIDIEKDFDPDLYVKLTDKRIFIPKKKYNILIEADKLISNDNDGVKRYVVDLIKGFNIVSNSIYSKWNFDLIINNQIINLDSFNLENYKSFNRNEIINESEGNAYSKKNVFAEFEKRIVSAIPAKLISWLKRNEITIFHTVYKLVRRVFLFSFLKSRMLLLRFLEVIDIQVVGAWRWMHVDNLYKQFEKYDLIHLPLQQHYKSFKRTTVPIIVTIHDFSHSIFPQFHTKINIWNARRGLQLIKKKKADIIAVSESTLKDIRNLTGFTNDKLHMVYESVDEKVFRYIENKDDADHIKDKYKIPRDIPYILLLSTIEPRKNLRNTLKAFNLLLSRHPEINLELVIAGKKGWKSDLISGDYRNVVFTGFVDDSDLSYLYSNALCFSYVSYYEGFGLPLLEAMRCGTPVVYGNNSSMPEVAGAGGLPANPYSPEDICDKFELMYFNKNKREELRNEALKQTQKFSSYHTSKRILQVYQDVIEKNKNGKYQG